MSRKYTLKQRAAQQDDTRRRITEAIVALHGSVGPAETTVSAIAERAGVQRLTVYRHFPDEASLYAACTAHFQALHPPPDPAALADIANPGDRLRAALTVLYTYYRETEAMTANVQRDAPRVPVLRSYVEESEKALAGLAEWLIAGLPPAGARGAVVAAAIRHALAFTTWQSLAGQGGAGLTDDQAGDLMGCLVRCAEASSPGAGVVSSPDRNPAPGRGP